MRPETPSHSPTLEQLLSRIAKALDDETHWRILDTKSLDHCSLKFEYSRDKKLRIRAVDSEVDMLLWSGTDRLLAARKWLAFTS